MRALLAVAFLAVGCGTTSTAAESESEVIGGAPEAGYAAVGFLRDTHFGADGATNVTCGATLIAPDVAITAAHCVENTTDAERFIVGFGTIADEPPAPANAAARSSKRSGIRAT